MSAPSVAVIVVNFNGAEVLRDCLSSLSKSTYYSTIIVVDNGSTDNSRSIVQTEFPNARLISSKENLGFAAGNNLGIRSALADNHDYIFVLNNDTLVDRSCIEHLVKRAEENSRIGAVSPKILFADPPDRIWFAGGSYNLWSGVSRHFGLRAHADTAKYNIPRLISFATGCAVLLRSAALSEVGLFDETLFMYHEDADLSYRLKAAGWELVYEPRAIVWHKEAWTTRRTIGRSWGLRLCVRNILAVHRKHRRWYHAFTFYPSFSWRWLVLPIINALVHNRPDVIKGIVGGVAAYLRNEQGKPLK
jgi:GT2 family glycosyltransferase